MAAAVSVSFACGLRSPPLRLVLLLVLVQCFLPHQGC